jgi:uncharacterized Zn finger protein
MEEPTAEGTATEPSTPRPPRLLAAALHCDNCDATTPHRILRLDRRSRATAGRIGGVARCRTCQFTHPFETVLDDRVELSLIVSVGPISERERLVLPRRRRLQVGSGVPESPSPLTIHRLEDRSGRSIPEGLAGDVATVWATRDEGAVVLVSVVDGAETRAVRLTIPPDTMLVVGDRMTAGRFEVRIFALRARGRTWRQPGDRFEAREVGRVYGRRTARPPAGRSDWRRVREMPSSRASSTSRSERSRSGPGVRRTRTVPRARNASGGAAVQRRSPS